MEITAKIEGIEYTPYLCRELKEYSIDDIEIALNKDATFILNVDKHKLAVSWWVSAKRTRSYPYARVYDALGFSGKKVTIIPIFKDEGKEGDRDFLQWDTISLMSLLGVYVIIGYYSDAEQSSRYSNKITNQQFDMTYIKNQIKKILSYQSDALHWNISQANKVWEIGKKALECYASISKNIGVEMHSTKTAEKRLEKLKEGKDAFMELSRDLAKRAQERESITTQPKENVDGTKAIITIKNYLGGNYYFTADEIVIEENKIELIEAKHTKEDKLPSSGDIKDGLLKMILFTNLMDVKQDNKKMKPVPIIKLTTGNNFLLDSLNKNEQKLLDDLKKEAKMNRFKIIINKSVYE